VIVLIGFMGAGKTTVGHILAERLGLPFVDSDLVLERRTGRAVAELIANLGEPTFRDMERQTIVELLNGPEAVLALGGGALEDPRSRTALSSSRVVYLEVGYAEAIDRVRHDTFRPLLHRPNLEALYTARLGSYKSAATITVVTNGRRAETVAQDVLQELTRPRHVPGGTDTVLVTSTGGSYNVHVGLDIHDRAAQLLPDLPNARQAFLAAGEQDVAVAETVARGLRARGLATTLLPIADTERAKSLHTVDSLAAELAEHAAHKKDLLVAIGSEPVCDIAGFLAATYNRGMPLALVPTTLVAQADSAIGGKNAVHLAQGRNLLGTIHQPVAVVCDTRLALRDLDRGFRAGLAEIAKHALIGHSPLLGLLTRSAREVAAGDAALIREITALSVRTKADIVSRDERELGDRLFLNYGHTFGHAIEHITGYDGDDQGASVSIGMMAAAHLACRQERIDEALVATHHALLTGLGLPTAGRYELAAMHRAWLHDKKYQDGVRFVLLDGLGEPVSGVTADDATLSAVLDDLAAQAGAA
jgi:shikimate kinase / 3-dehydroquinate synthase